jgi:uncharacterized membrane protein
MIDRRLRNVRPKDLSFVLLYGLLLPFVFGIVAGLVALYVESAVGIGVGTLFFWFIAVYCGNVVRKQYEHPHLLYAIVTGCGLLLAAVVIYTVPIVVAVSLASGGSLLVVFHPMNYLYYSLYLFNPWNWVAHGSLILTIWIVSIAIGTYLGVRKACARIY